MELYQLRQFAAVAKYENMTRAAESLNVAQPAVSKTIRNLESELGAELFERTGKGLRRTEISCCGTHGRYWKPSATHAAKLRRACTVQEVCASVRCRAQSVSARYSRGFPPSTAIWICASAVRPRAATCCSIPRYRGTRCLQAPSCCTMRRCAWLCPRDTGMPIGKAYR